MKTPVISAFSSFCFWKTIWAVGALWGCPWIHCELNGHNTQYIGYNYKETKSFLHSITKNTNKCLLHNANGSSFGQVEPSWWELPREGPKPDGLTHVKDWMGVRYPWVHALLRIESCCVSASGRVPLVLSISSLLPSLSFSPPSPFRGMPCPACLTPQLITLSFNQPSGGIQIN